jgi:hypothetical protein
LVVQAYKSWPETTRVKGVINAAVSCTSDTSEAESGTSSRFVFRTTAGKGCCCSLSLLSSSLIMHTCIKKRIISGALLFCRRWLCLSDIDDSFSVATVPIGARCDDFSPSPNLQEVSSSDEKVVPSLLLSFYLLNANVLLGNNLLRRNIGWPVRALH